MGVKGRKLRETAVALRTGWDELKLDGPCEVNSPFTVTVSTGRTKLMGDGEPVTLARRSIMDVAVGDALCAARTDA